ncbi:hypothetical protein G7K_2863-t1 [Saitoella complicata NRRL Y-17804]|uniref:Uncharacterized protein n=1 Tax=Saitoella complicata (strain BCRC 22490 / CBS 7301 / JCM 7358 / NBRC 10748 / NRRL Y-17804) TaxID=698492 RepID=A0A0E9NFV4_SAICN|nr:hypothetical protein G7K_2863-t1 [Saitoella complicata NRRL Y-17804]
MPLPSSGHGGTTMRTVIPAPTSVEKTVYLMSWRASPTMKPTMAEMIRIDWVSVSARRWPWKSYNPPLEWLKKEEENGIRCSPVPACLRWMPLILWCTTFRLHGLACQIAKLELNRGGRVISARTTKAKEKQCNQSSNSRGSRGLLIVVALFTPINHPVTSPPDRGTETPTSPHNHFRRGHKERKALHLCSYPSRFVNRYFSLTSSIKVGGLYASFHPARSPVHLSLSDGSTSFLERRRQEAAIIGLCLLFSLKLSLSSSVERNLILLSRKTTSKYRILLGSLLSPL